MDQTQMQVKELYEQIGQLFMDINKMRNHMNFQGKVIQERDATIKELEKKIKGLEHGETEEGESPTQTDSG